MSFELDEAILFFFKKQLIADNEVKRDESWTMMSSMFMTSVKKHNCELVKTIIFKMPNAQLLLPMIGKALMQYVIPNDDVMVLESIVESLRHIGGGNDNLMNRVIRETFNDEVGRTANLLHIALSQNAISCLPLLISVSDSTVLNAFNRYGMTPFHVAVDMAYAEALRGMLITKADSIDVNIRTIAPTTNIIVDNGGDGDSDGDGSGGQTALHLALYNMLFHAPSLDYSAMVHSVLPGAIVSTLMEFEGTDPNIKDTWGETPLHMVLRLSIEFKDPPAQYQWLEALRILLSNPRTDMNMKMQATMGMEMEMAMDETGDAGDSNGDGSSVMECFCKLVYGQGTIYHELASTAMGILMNRPDLPNDDIELALNNCGFRHIPRWNLSRPVHDFPLSYPEQPLNDITLYGRFYHLIDMAVDTGEHQYWMNSRASTSFLNSLQLPLRISHSIGHDAGKKFDEESSNRYGDGRWGWRWGGRWAMGEELTPIVLNHMKMPSP